MNTVILQIASKYVRGLLVLFAILALIRGHNYPGGGFIGGLLAALSVVYKGFAYTPEIAKEKILIKPEGYIISGLLLIWLSFLPSIFKNVDFMTGIWFTLFLPFFGELKLGTPFIFDVGVFLTVTGVILLFMFTLIRQVSWK